MRAAFDDGTGRRASAPWETLGAGETRRWRITYDPGDAESFAEEWLSSYRSEYPGPGRAAQWFTSRPGPGALMS